MTKCLGTSKSYTTDALKASSSLILYLTTLSFSNLLCKTKSLIRTIVSRSFSLKLLSRLILSIFTVRIPMLLQQNVTSQESSHEKCEPSFEYKAVQPFFL